MELEQANQAVPPISSLPAYLVIDKENDEDFSFITANGIEYSIYFCEADGYAPSASFAFKLRTLGFNVIKETWPKGKKLPKDPNVGGALFDTIYYYMTRHPERTLVFVCGDQSTWQPEVKDPRLARQRSQLFSGWYDEWQKISVLPAEKIDYTLHGELYGSCIFASGHPDEAEIRQVISRTILEKQL